MRTLTAQQLTPVCTDHGEGPFWDGERLLVVDLLAGAIVAVSPDGETQRHELGGVVAVIRARSAGGYVIATEHGFRLLTADLTAAGEEILAFDVPEIRMNDGGCDPQGRFYCGTMAYATTPGVGALYRLSPDRTVERVMCGLTIANGLQWHPDGRHVYHTDTPTGGIDLVDFDPVHGTFGARERFVEITPSGQPDGMALDTEGGVWTALWGGSAVQRYDADGTLTHRVELPVRQVSACAFGGDGTLYITTSRQDLGENAEPEAGAVFAVRVPFQGAPVHEFAG
jgi:sugar lactone lactonase YvrE